MERDASGGDGSPETHDPRWTRENRARRADPLNRKRAKECAAPDAAAPGGGNAADGSNLIVLVQSARPSGAHGAPAFAARRGRTAEADGREPTLTPRRPNET